MDPNNSTQSPLAASIAHTIAQLCPSDQASVVSGFYALAAPYLAHAGVTTPAEPEPVAEANEDAGDVDESLPPLDRAMRLALRRLKRGDCTTADLADACERTGKTISNWCSEGGPLQAYGVQRIRKGLYSWPGAVDIPLDED